MSATQPKSRNEEITERDLFGSIPKALDINPFEGINLDEIALKPQRKGPSEEDDLSVINPIQDIDVDEISAVPVAAPEAEEHLEIVEINPIEEEHVAGLNDIHPTSPSAALQTVSGIGSTVIKPNLFQKLKGLFLRDSRSPQPPSTDRPADGSESQRTKQPPSPLTDAPSAAVRIQKTTPKQKAVSKSFLKLRISDTYPPLSPALVKQAYNYAEIYRIREKVLTALGNHAHKVVMTASPHDNTGNTFMVSVLGLNAAAYTQMNLLLLDMNMRRAQLHLAFGLPLENGFCDIATGSVHWSDVIKDTELPNLKLISAGTPVKDLANYLNKDFLESLLTDVKNEFDMVLLDTSPVMVRNRNNVDPILLGRMSDIVIVIARNKHTSRSALVNTVQAIVQDGGNIIGIVYNQ